MVSEKVPVQVPVQVPEKVWEALSGSTGLRRKSGKLWCRARSKSQQGFGESSGEGVTVRGFGAEPG